MVDEGPVMTWRAGPDRLKDHFNRAWLQYRGRTLQQEMGHGWMEGVHPDEMAIWIEEYEASFNQRRSFQTEYQLQRSDGAYRWIIDLGVPRFSPGGAFLDYVGFSSDIHERKVNQQTLRDSNDN